MGPGKQAQQSSEVKQTSFRANVDLRLSSANCFEPVLSRGVMLLSSTSTFPGAVIMYNCSEGFQPGTINSSVCGDNGLWSPNATLHTCTG